MKELLNNTFLLAFLLSALLSVDLEGREVLSPPSTVFSFAQFLLRFGFSAPSSSAVSRSTGRPRDHCIIPTVQCTNHSILTPCSLPCSQIGWCRRPPHYAAALKCGA